MGALCYACGWWARNSRRSHPRRTPTLRARERKGLESLSEACGCIVPCLQLVRKEVKEIFTLKNCSIARTCVKSLSCCVRLVVCWCFRKMLNLLKFENSLDIVGLGIPHRKPKHCVARLFLYFFSVHSLLILFILFFIVSFLFIHCLSILCFKPRAGPCASWSRSWMNSARDPTSLTCLPQVCGI